MNISELRTLSLEELDLKERETQEAWLKDRIKQSFGQLEKTHRLALNRKTVARIKTVRDERTRGASRAKGQ